MSAIKNELVIGEYTLQKYLYYQRSSCKSLLLKDHVNENEKKVN